MAGDTGDLSPLQAEQGILRQLLLPERLVAQSRIEAAQHDAGQTMGDGDAAGAQTRIMEPVVAARLQAGQPLAIWRLQVPVRLASLQGKTEGADLVEATLFPLPQAQLLEPLIDPDPVMAHAQLVADEAGGLHGPSQGAGIEGPRCGVVQLLAKGGAHGAGLLFPQGGEGGVAVALQSLLGIEAGLAVA